jgi:signal transduction histidine kinase
MNSHRTKNLLLTLPAVLSFIIVSLSGLLDLETSQQRIWAAGLLAVYGILFLALNLHRLPPIGEHACVAVMTACVASLLIFQPGWGVFPILFFVLGPMVMIHFPLRVGLMWIGIFTLIIGIVFFASISLDGLLSWLVYSVGNLFFGMFGYAMRQSEEERKRSQQLLIELQEAHEKLQAYTEQLEELTIAQERNRIAREMHDTLGHRLTIAAVQLEGAQRLVHKNPERAETMIGTVRDQVREGLSDLRRTVAMLRASPNEELPIELALQKLVQQAAEATGIQIHLSVDDSYQDLPVTYQQALYRATQEALTNIHRHARATEAWIQFAEGQDHVTLLIGDNGIGIENEKEQAGFGLSGLRERAMLLGGECYIDKRAGGGTQLSFWLPLPEKRAEPG